MVRPSTLSESAFARVLNSRCNDSPIRIQSPPPSSPGAFSIMRSTETFIQYTNRPGMRILPSALAYNTSRFLVCCAPAGRGGSPGEEAPECVEDPETARFTLGPVVEAVEMDAVLGVGEPGAAVHRLEFEGSDRRRDVHAVDPHVVTGDDPVVLHDVGADGLVARSGAAVELCVCD